MSQIEAMEIAEILGFLFDAGKPATENKGGCRRNAGDGKKTRRERQADSIEDALEAVRTEDFQTLTTLVTTPKQANWHSKKSAWCLLDVAVKQDSLTMVSWLLDKGANPNTLFFRDTLHSRRRFEPGLYFSPFATAISNGQSDIALLLLERGASLDLPIVWCDADDFQSCRDLAIEKGLWPRMEAFLLTQSLASAAADTGRVRRL